MVAASKPAVIPTELTPLGYALAGALGGVFSNSIVYPLDTVKTRIQAASPSKDGSGKRPTQVELLIRIFKEEGFWAYYKGFTASMINTFSMQYAYFFFYSLVRTTYLKSRARSLGLAPGAKPPNPGTAAELSLGALAGALAQIFTIPVAVIATRQQVMTSDKKGKGKESSGGFFDVAREIIKEDGVQGLWLGIGPGLVLTVNPAITYGVFERVKGIFLLGQPEGTKLSPVRSFVVGALSKTLATIVTYPYIMAKVRVQTRSVEEDKETDTLEKVENGGPKPSKKSIKHDGALQILAKVYKEKGFVGWYQGMNAQITKAVLSQALLFMSKEQFERYALVIMIAWARLIG